MSVYLNGSNTQNIVAGAGLAATAHDDYGNSTLSVTASGIAGAALQSLGLGQFAATTSAQLSGVMSDETGTGLLVFGTSPTLTTPVVAGGLTASGAGAVDFSASTATFKLPSGGLLGNAGAGLANRFWSNSATTGQTPAATTRTYVTGSAIGPFTAGQLVVGTILRWAFDMTKTGAGSATSTFDIAFGTAGTTADTAYVSFTKPAGTGVIDQGWVEISAVVKTAGASGVVLGNFRLGHNLAATGHAVIPYVSVVTTSGTVNLATPTFVGVCITTGAADAITINQVESEAINL